jgi:hypothetical protein
MDLLISEINALNEQHNSQPTVAGIIVDMEREIERAIRKAFKRIDRLTDGEKGGLKS